MESADIKIDYRLLFTHSPELSLLLDCNSPEFKILDASDAYLKATNTHKKDILGQGFLKIFSAKVQDQDNDSTVVLKNCLENVLKAKKMNTAVVSKHELHSQAVADRSAEIFWNTRNTPIFDKGGNMLYILHQAVEITTIAISDKYNPINESAENILRQKTLKLKQNNQRLNIILDALVKYTAMDFSDRLETSHRGDELDAIVLGINTLIDELENNINLLTESNQALADANYELDSFSYSVSHDLRAPLRGINGYSQVLLEDYADKLDEEGKNNINIIIKNALKMGSLIDDLLTFSRVGKQNITKVPLNMNGIVKNIINELNINKLWKATMDIKILEDAEGDYSMIVQVMTNLISNAIKYSSKKTAPRVEIGSYKDHENTTYYVKDNGAGFDMKYYAKLFGVFQRLHGAAEFEGTGVGLALVHRIIKKHHGDIWAEAIPDEGALFSFTLPNATN